MAFLDDILGGANRLAIGEKGGDPIVVDASVREVHSVTGEVSDHPVESGIDIVDHYRVLPRKIEIEAIVTNTPISTGLPGATLINSIIGLVQGDKDPSSNAWNEFERFFDEAVVLDIKTSLKSYTNMVLTDLAVTRDSKTGQVLSFTASAREVRFVDTQFGEAIALPVSTTGQSEKSAGKKTNASANETQAGASKSLAAKGLDAGIAFFTGGG